VRDRKPLLQSAVEAARARFRPILMTSFAFILGVVPLVLATAPVPTPQVDRYHRIQRNDRFDLPGGAVRSDVLRRGATIRELACGAEWQAKPPLESDPTGAERYVVICGKGMLVTSDLRRRRSRNSFRFCEKGRASMEDVAAQRAAQSLLAEHKANVRFKTLVPRMRPPRSRTPTISRRDMWRFCAANHATASATRSG